MRTPAGFKRDMQFEVEVIKDFDAEGGAGQIVRGVHMRLHAGSHVDAPEHFVKGGKQIHELPLETFVGPAVIADVRHRMPGGGITAADLEKACGEDLGHGERILLRTDCNVDYDGSMEWQKRSPYLTNDAIDWCLAKGVLIVGFDMYHGADAPNSNVVFNTSRRFQEAWRRDHAVPEESGRHQQKARNAGCAAAQDDRRRGLADPRHRAGGLMTEPRQSDAWSRCRRWSPARPITSGSA
jgi:kynurenine formamidase